MKAYRNSEVAESSYVSVINELIEKVDHHLNLSTDTRLLETQIEFMRFCLKCDCETIFTAVLECQHGLIGCCRGCGDERLIPFSRMNSEVA